MRQNYIRPGRPDSYYLRVGRITTVIMLAMGVIFLAWVLFKPPAPVTTAEAEAARKAREEFGTQAPGH